ncbi:IS1 family transposase, partial [Escherichia coli]
MASVSISCPSCSATDGVVPGSDTHLRVHETRQD